MELRYTQAVVDFPITTGSTYYATGIVAQLGADDEYYAVDLTNCHVTGKARLAYNEAAESFWLPLKKDDDQVNNTGKVHLFFDPITTSKYRPDGKPKKFIYDMDVVDAEGNCFTFQKGTITFEQDVTYPD